MSDDDRGLANLSGSKPEPMKASIGAEENDADRVDSWAYPLPMGRRLLWRWDDQNRSIPVMSVESIWTNDKADDIMNGWTAVLPTENETIIHLVWDPESNGLHPLEKPLAMFLYVQNPAYDCEVDAWVEDDQVVYDPRCTGGECQGCDHMAPPPFDGHMRYVGSPDEVMACLSEWGSHPLKVGRRDALRIMGGES